MITPESDGSPGYQAGSDHQKDGQAAGWWDNTVHIDSMMRDVQR
jgi:hypothetical protein